MIQRARVRTRFNFVHAEKDVVSLSLKLEIVPVFVSPHNDLCVTG